MSMKSEQQTSISFTTKFFKNILQNISLHVSNEHFREQLGYSSTDHWHTEIVNGETQTYQMLLKMMNQPNWAD